jgi:hypothetical protein
MLLIFAAARSRLPAVTVNNMKKFATRRTPRSFSRILCHFSGASPVSRLPHLPALRNAPVFPPYTSAAILPFVPTPPTLTKPVIFTFDFLLSFTFHFSYF